jgi:hypothetical protein
MAELRTLGVDELHHQPGAPSNRGGLSLPELWVVVAVVIPIVAALAAANLIRDLGFQVRAGEVILRTHELIRRDTFTFTAGGYPYLDQQWGSDILFALVYRWMGWEGFAIVRAALVGLIFLFVYLAVRGTGTAMNVAAWLTIGSFLVAVEHLRLRPQLVAGALFACTLWLVAGRERHPRRLWAIPLLVVVWSNVHGTFFLGPLVLGLAWLADRQAPSPGQARTLGVALAALAATLLNPFGPRIWTYAWRLSTNPLVTRFVGEWRPPSLREVDGAMFFASALAVAGFVALRRRPTPWSTLLTLGVFALIALQASRGILWWALAAPVAIGGLIQSPVTAGEQRGPHRSRVNSVVVLLVATLGISLLPWWRDANPIARSSGLFADAPARLTSGLQSLARPGQRIFNPEAWGSWLELHLPRNRTFVDFRIEIFPPSVWHQYVQVSFGQEGWQRILDRWHIEVVVADRGEQAGLIPFILRDEGWRLIYRDDRGMVFVRASPTPG